MNISDVLSSLGYNFQDCGSYYRCNAAYRGAHDIGSLVVYKDSGKFFDYPQNISGTLKDLIKLSNGDVAIEIKPQAEKERQSKIYDDSLLDELIPNYSFFKNRGISEVTQKIFEAGFCHKDTLNNRVVFPVRDYNLNIIGFSGRTTRSDFEKRNVPKWKTIGAKRNFIYPWHISDYFIKKENSVILVESIGDTLALYENGIRNIICLFGLNVSSKIIDYLSSLNIKEIIISTNNDFESNRGNEAAKSIKLKLDNLFDLVNIILPTEYKDWGEYIKNNKKIIL